MSSRVHSVHMTCLPLSDCRGLLNSEGVQSSPFFFTSDPPSGSRGWYPTDGVFGPRGVTYCGRTGLDETYVCTVDVSEGNGRRVG